MTLMKVVAAQMTILLCEGCEMSAIAGKQDLDKDLDKDPDQDQDQDPDQDQDHPADL